VGSKENKSIHYLSWLSSTLGEAYEAVNLANSFKDVKIKEYSSKPCTQRETQEIQKACLSCFLNSVKNMRRSEVMHNGWLGEEPARARLHIMAIDVSAGLKYFRQTG